MGKLRRRIRDWEEIRYFNDDEISRIYDQGVDWFVRMASVDGSLDHHFMTECIAEATVRLLAASGRLVKKP